MQKCPFCEFDRGEAPAYEGRCPNCGNIVQWPEEEADPLAEALPEAQPDEVPPRPSPVDASSDVGKATELFPVASPVSDPQLLPGDFIDTLHLDSQPASENLNTMWRDSIAGEVRLGATLKGPSAAATVSDSVFSIQHRELRSADGSTGEGADYELLNVIGQGGVGVVYAARQASIDRKVAIKMLREQFGQRSEHRDKFLAEAVVTGELDHPNIVPIYDLGRSVSGELFYSMKNVVGTAWEAVIRQKPLRENIEILMKVADAVAFAHSRGVVHRDLKPENVMLGEFGEVLVMDWGIALPTAGFSKSASILRSQAMGGTPAYMAPEMAAGPLDSIGPAADVYLLGAILYEILTGKPPHHGRDVMECIVNAANNVIQPTEVRGELFEIARKAMATLPRRRYRSVLDFQAAIRLYQSHIESINLSDNAEQDLQSAVANRDYQQLSRVVFAFREALALWSDNTTAADGLVRAQIAYATAALDKGDYDLGLSLLEEDKLEHQPLIAALTKARHEREARQSRLRAIRKVAVGLMGFIIVAGTAVLLVILQLFSQAKTLNQELAVAQQGLEQEIVNVTRERKRADEQRQRAEAQTVEALTQRALAEARRLDAEAARMESIAQRVRAEENSYFAETGLLTASIEQNGFGIAAALLRGQAASPSKSKLRHWEWGRNQFLVHGGDPATGAGSVTTHLMPTGVCSLDRSADGKWIAIGLPTGECSLWRPGHATPQFTVQHGWTLTDVAFDAASQRLVTCGGDSTQSGSLKIWQIDDEQKPELLRELGLPAMPRCVAFSHDRQAEYVACGDDQRVARVWQWREETAPSVLLGHLDAITCVRFSSDNGLLATASLDGSVRLWARQSAIEVQRFTAHAAGVHAVEFAPEAGWMASAGADQRILLWRLEPRQSENDAIEEIRQRLRDVPPPPPTYQTLTGHAAPIRDLCFSPDGVHLLSCSNDNSVCVWNVAQRLETTPTGHSPAIADAEPPTAGSLVKRLRGHGGWVGACCFSADGREVYSGGDDNCWKTWRWNDYFEQRVVGDGQQPILDAAYAPAGNQLATALADGRIMLWDAASGTEVASLREGHEYLTNRAQFVAAERKLVTAAGDNTLRLWDVERGTQAAVLENAGRNALFSLSEDGRWLVCTGDEAGLGVWDVTQPQQPPIHLRAWHAKPQGKSPATFVEPTCVGISANGGLVCVGDREGACEFWDVATGERIRRIFGHSDTVIAAYFVAAPAGGPEEQAVVTVSTDGTAAWWNPASGEELDVARLRHFAPLQRASLSADRQRLACAASVAEGDAKLWLWDLPSQKLLASSRLSGQLVQELAFSQQHPEQLVVTTSGADDSRKRIWIWNAAQDQWQSLGGAAMNSSSLWGAIPTADGTRLLTFGGRGARLWDVATAREVMSYRPSAAVQAIAFSPDGRRLAAGASDGSIELWDVARQTAERKLPGGHRQAVSDVCFSPDGRELLSCGLDGRIQLWEVEGGKPIQHADISQTAVACLSARFYPDGRQIAVAAADHILRIYTVAGFELVREISGHTGAVTCVDISADGRWLATGSADKSVRVWSATSGELWAQMQGHSAAVSAVNFSSDNLRLLSCGQDSQTRLWDVSLVAGNADDEPTAGWEEIEIGELLSLNLHQQPVVAAEFSPDGRSVLTASHDGTAAIWPAAAVAPALRMTSSVSYRLGSGSQIVDPAAVVSLPGTFDARGGTLRVTLEAVADLTERLALDTQDGRLSIDEGQILCHSSESAPKVVGTIAVQHDTQLEINFGAQATSDLVQQVVRHISYRGEQLNPELASNTRPISFYLCDAQGGSGNAQAEVVSIYVRPDNL